MAILFMAPSRIFALGLERWYYFFETFFVIYSIVIIYDDDLDNNHLDVFLKKG